MDALGDCNSLDFIFIYVLLYGISLLSKKKLELTTTVYSQIRIYQDDNLTGEVLKQRTCFSWKIIMTSA